MEKEEGKSLVKKEKKINKQIILWISIVVVTILIDQIGKIWIQQAGEITIIPKVLSFKVSQNTEPAYGIGSNSTWMYVATNLVILSVIFKFINTQNQFVDKKLKIFLSFILAGGIANVIDRVIHGYVTEFINIIGLPVLNLADILVLIGWMAVAAIFASFTVKEWRNKKN